MWRSVAVVALVAACGKHAAPDCEHAGDGTRAFWDGKLAGAKTEIERTLAKAMLEVAPARLVRHCKADGWSAEAAACGKIDSERCLSLLTQAQQDALRSDPEAQALTKQQPLELPAACERYPLAIVLSRDGVRIGVPHGGACRRPREALERELRALIGHAEGCRMPVEISATADLSYQDLVSTMDLATRLGMKDVSIGSEIDFHDDMADCPVPAARHDAQPASSEAVGSNLGHVPVVIVTKDGIEYAGKRLANADELERVLPPHPADGRAILQADESTSALLVHRIVEACKRAGYDNVLFAVKTK